MKKRILLWAVILFAVTTGSLIAGGQSEAVDKGPSIAVVTPYMANATTAFVIERFEIYAEEHGWEVSVADTAGDFGLLVSRIEDAITKKADAIVLGMGDPVQMTKGLNAAREAGIPVFGLDAGITEGVLLNVTSDNNDLGTKSAQALVDALDGKGNIILFTHDPHPGVRARAEGARELFATYPDITIVQEFHIEVPGPVDNARKIAEDLITSYPEKGSLVGIWAGWDEPAFGATQALYAGDRTEIKVVGIDGTDFAKAEIDKGGPFTATIEQDFDGMAKKLVSLIDEYFKGTTPEKEWYMIPGKMYN